jgi:hypothetical protein
MSIRDKVAAESRLRSWRNGLRFPDCRIRVWGAILDRHEDYGIVAIPAHCQHAERDWRGYYAYDAGKGQLVLTGIGAGNPPAILPLRGVVEDGLILGRLVERVQSDCVESRRYDAEEEVVRHLVPDEQEWQRTYGHRLEET